MPASYAILESALDRIPAALAAELPLEQLPVVSSADAVEYFLDWQAAGLVLQHANGEQLRATLARPHRPHARQPFTRALSAARDATVIEATAGLGGDTLRLAMLASSVISIERHPLVCAMLAAALYEARSAGWPAAARVRVLAGDARQLLGGLRPAEVVYLDPMFPPKRHRSALPPKPLRMLRDLLGENDDDDAQLLRVARRHALQRVVVKRPLHAPQLASDACAVHPGKVVRYEVYLPMQVTP
jgi:16S rRNA (guanine1516-N2)-methyltransferase